MEKSLNLSNMALWDLGVELETRSPGSGGCLMLGGSIGCWALTGGRGR